jgi:hypothetical protein
MDLVRPPDQISDERGNMVYYSLRRVVELLAQANPNILELLFMPEDCVLKSSPEMQSLVAHRGLFISKQCADTHAGYAMSQIRKAKGTAPCCTLQVSLLLTQVLDGCGPPSTSASANSDRPRHR